MRPPAAVARRRRSRAESVACAEAIQARDLALIGMLEAAGGLEWTVE
jgi:hypothetical protein